MPLGSDNMRPELKGSQETLGGAPGPRWFDLIFCGFVLKCRPVSTNINADLLGSGDPQYARHW